MKKISSELELIDLFLCFFLSLAFSASGYYIETGDCELSFDFFLTVFIWLLVLLIMASIGRYYFANTGSLSRSGIITKASSWFTIIMEKNNHILIIAGVIFLCWLPILVFLYPGTCINDTWSELQQYIGFKSGTGQLYDHHPIFDTLVMGIMIVPLAEITGSWHVVMFVYVILQAACTSIAFSFTIDYAYKKLCIDNKYLLFALVFYCVVPIYPASVQTISKDALFGWIFVFFFTFSIEIVRSKGACFKDYRFLLIYILLSVLCCLTKKVGFYVVLLSQIGYLLFHKESRRKVIISTICVVLVMCVLMPIIQNELDVKPGGKQEMFSLPFQMTARYVKNCDDEIGETEKIIINKVLDYDVLAERYQPIDADPVKQYSQKGEDSDYIAYIKVWAKQGTRHPGVYISAMNAMLSGWFSFYEYKPLMNMDWHNQLNIKMIPEWVTERDFSRMSADAFQETYDNIYENPFLRIILSYGLYSALIPAFAIGTVLRRRKVNSNYWLTMLPIVFSLILGCWLSPKSIQVEGVRYLYPLTYTAPLLIMWCKYIYQSTVIKRDEGR